MKFDYCNNIQERKGIFNQRLIYNKIVLRCEGLILMIQGFGGRVKTEEFNFLADF